MMKVVTAVTPLKSIPTPWCQGRGRRKPLGFWPCYYILPVTSSARRYMYCGMWRCLRPVCRVPWPSFSPFVKIEIFLWHVVMVTLSFMSYAMTHQCKSCQIVSENANDQILRSFGSGSNLFSFYWSVISILRLPSLPVNQKLKCF